MDRSTTIAKWVLAVAAITAVALMAGVYFLPSEKPFAPAERQVGKDVAWVTTPEATVHKMLDLAQVTSRDYVIDLGSGDGRIAIAAAKRGARALGIEYDADLVERSSEWAAKAGLSEKAQFVQGDLFESDFSPATVVTMYLNRRINLQLRPKLLELKPGTRIVSNSFDLDDWEPDETGEVTEGDIAYLWIVPAKVGGSWEISGGELTLKQTFQMVAGTMTSGTKKVAIADGRLRGDEFRFRVDNLEYVGQVNGASIEGVMKRDGKEVEWSAQKTSP